MPSQRRQEREPLREEDVQGLKYFRKLSPLFERLHDEGCGRDKAGNRQLFMDQYCGLVLLFMFNPCVRSLRALQQAAELKNVQLGCGRASLGSLSEATDVFDPQRLREIIGPLAAEVKPTRNVTQEHVRQLLVAVDGSVIETLSTIAAAAYLKTKNGDSRSAWRLHIHFDVDRSVPTRIDVTTARNSGKSEEKSVLRTQLAADHCYLMDRWYAQFTLFNEIHALGSSYVCRVRDNSRYEILQERSLSEAARAAGVLQDALVTLGTTSLPASRPDHPIRLVLVKCTPHQKTGGRKGASAGPPADGILRIATNLRDPPAEIIAELYRQRWTIELFFRFFKHVLGCRHLLSTARAGIEIQTYMAIIACLLLALWTGGKPTLRTYEMVCLYLQGWADEEELLAHLAKLKPHGA
jgi:Transposase DDE domain